MQIRPAGTTPGICFRHQCQAPQAFVTLVIPFRGSDVPSARCQYPTGLVAGATCVQLGNSAFRIGRDLQQGTAWQNRSD
jgi:hypothetical protein